MIKVYRDGTVWWAGGTLPRLIQFGSGGEWRGEAEFDLQMALRGLRRTAQWSRTRFSGTGTPFVPVWEVGVGPLSETLENEPAQ